MTSKLLNKKSFRIVTFLVLFVALLVTNNQGLISQARAATLSGGFTLLADPRPTQSSTYTIEFDGVTTSAIKCIKVAFSDSATGGSKPTGINISSAALSGTSDFIPTPASWSISNNNTSGVSSITFASGETPASASDRTLVLTSITNGSTAGTGYFVQLSTYNNTDCSSSPVDSGVVSFIYSNGQAVSLSVDPTISFTISAVNSSQSVNSATTTVSTTTTTIPLGAVTASANAIAAHDLSVTTNSNAGYTVYIRYTGALGSGAHDITDHSGSNASPSTFSAAGTEAFGYTTEDTSLGTGTAGRFGSGKWAAFTTSNAEVAYNATAVSAQTTRIGYQAGVSGTTPAGSYSTTVVLTAVPTY